MSFNICDREQQHYEHLCDLMQAINLAFKFGDCHRYKFTCEMLRYNLEYMLKETDSDCNLRQYD